MRTIFLILFTISIVSVLKAQDVKLKKGTVSIDNKDCLSYEKSNANNVELTMADGKQTILLKFIRTGVGPNDGLYTKVIFVEQKKSLTSRSYIFNKKLLVKKLLKDKVIDNCLFDETKIDKFIMKYDEQIEESLIRH